MEILNLIDSAIAEDVGDGDHTSLSCIPADAIGKAQLLVKQPGILAGMEIAKMVFNRIDKDLIFNPILNDGDKIEMGDIAFTIEGNNQSILKAE